MGYLLYQLVQDFVHQPYVNTKFVAAFRRFIQPVRPTWILWGFHRFHHRLLAMDGFIVLVSFVEVSGIPWEWQPQWSCWVLLPVKERGKFHWILCLDEGSVNLFKMCIYLFIYIYILTDLTDENWLYSLCIRVIYMVRLSIWLITLCISVEIEVTLFIAWRDSLFHGFLWFWQKVLGSRKHKKPYKSMYTWYIHDLYHFLQNGFFYYMLPTTSQQGFPAYQDYLGWWLMFHDLYWFIHVWFGIAFFWGEFSGYPGIPCHS